MLLRGDAEQHQRRPRRAPLNSRKQSAMCVLLFLVIVAYLQADSMSNSWFSPPLCGLRLPADGLREERALSRDSGVIVNADVCVCVRFPVSGNWNPCLFLFIWGLGPVDGADWRETRRISLSLSPAGGSQSHNISQRCSVKIAMCEVIRPQSNVFTRGDYNSPTSQINPDCELQEAKNKLRRFTINDVLGCVST